MVSTFRTVVVMASLVGAASGCGGEPARECQFNSNCPAGRYCTPAGMCVADCTPEGGECGAAADCNSFGMCVPRADAGSMPDAFSPPIDAFMARPDVGTDAYETPDGGPPPEVCTPSRTGSVAEDEDADGAIDEGCPWYFGVPHPVPSGAVYGGEMVETPRLSSNGLRLYVRGRQPGATPPQVPQVMSRAALGEPFGAPVLVPHTPPTMGYVSSFDLSADELEMWAQVPAGAAGMDLQVARRASDTEAFGALANAPELNSSMNDYHPFLRDDGLEILFVSARSGTPRIYRAVRIAASMAFEAPTELTFEAGPFDPPSMGEAYPSLSADGLTLFFGRDLPAGRRAYLARRTSRDSPAFGRPEEVAGLNAGEGRTEFVAVYEASREVFFSSDRPWAPGVGGWVWRAQICRDGPCVETPMDCPSGLRSQDGNHCYFATPTPASFAMADANCAALGGHPVTLTSEAEWSYVERSFRPSGTARTRIYIGLWDRDSDETFGWDWPSRDLGAAGEPLSFVQWATLGGAVQPSDTGGSEDVGELIWNWEAGQTPQGGWNDGPGTTAFTAVCERERWPSW